MNDTQLSLFITIADEGSFSRAEEKAYISKQAMFRQINALETEVGVRLFVRTSEGVTLTDAGREFYKGAEKMLRLQKNIVSRCRALVPSAKILRVGQVEHQALLNEVTDQFALKYPDIQIKRVVHPNHSGEYRVENDIIDVGETFFSVKSPTRNYTYTKLSDMPYLAAMRHGHPLGNQTSVNLQDLADYPVIIYDLMLKNEYIEVLEQLFRSHPERLIHQPDPDTQVATAFACQSSDAIFITANCFIRHIPELTVIPLDSGWYEEYGIIYRNNHSDIVDRYIRLAQELYQDT